MLPDEETIVQLAPSLGVDPDELWSRGQETYQERIQLLGFLEDLGIPRENWGEFFALKPTARSAFIKTIQTMLPSRSERRMHLEAVEDAIERDGLDNSLEIILAGLAEYGLSPLDYLRASVELEEMPGERAVFTDRLPISPVTVPIDWLYLFRASYGTDPPNPMLLKWWAETRRTAMVVTLKEHPSRTIVPIDRLRHYIRTGERAPNILLPPDIVVSHLVANIELLRQRPHYQLGLSDSSLPVIYRIKGDHHVLVTVHGYVFGPNSQHLRTTLRFSRPSVVKRFSEHFERQWSELARERKENQAVANWLEKHLADVGKRESR